MKKNNLFDKIFTLDEFRFSFIICIGFIITGVAVYISLNMGDIPDNMTSLLKVIVITVGTVSTVKGTDGLLNKINNIKSNTKTKGDVQ